MPNADADAESQNEPEPAEGLSDKDVESVAERRAASAKVVHEVIRLQGDEELDRPVLSQIFSGLAAGVAISASILAEAFLHMRLPDAPWAELVSALGYSVVPPGAKPDVQRTLPVLDQRGRTP